MLRRLLVFQAGPDAEPTALVNPEIEWISRGRRGRRGGLPQPARRARRRRAPAARPGQRPSTSTGEPIVARGLRPRGARAPARDRPSRRRADPRPRPARAAPGRAAGPARGRQLRPPHGRGGRGERGSTASRAPTREDRLPRHLRVRGDRASRRLAEPAHRPSLVVTPPDRRRAAAAAPSRRPPPRPRAELGIELHQTADVNAEAALERIRAAAPDAVVVCAFGQLIREPLLSRVADAQRAPLAAAALARRRADRARDHGRRRAHRRLRHAGDGGPRLRPGRAARGGPDRAERRLRERSRRSSPPLGGELLVGALDRLERGEPRLRRAGRGRGHLRGEDRLPGSAGSIPPAPAAELARIVRALTPHIGAYLELAAASGSGSATRPLGRRRRRSRAARRAESGDAAARLRPRGALRLEVVQPAGGRPMAADAYLRGHALPRLRATVSPARRRSPSRRSARPSRTAPTPSAPFARRPAERELEGRERAQAQRARLRRGAAAGHDRRLRSSGSPTAPAPSSTRRVARRACASASTSSSSPTATPDHAAVDQAVELVKGRGGSRTRLGIRQRGPAPRDPRARDACSRAARRRLDPEPAPRSPTRPRSGWREMWWERARPRLAPARCSPPATSRAERALRVNSLRGDRDAALAPCGRRGWRPRRRTGRRPLAARSSRSATGERGWGGGEVSGRRRDGSIAAESRASAASWSRCSTRSPGEHVLDLCAGPGIKTGQIARADGRSAARLIVGRARPRPGRRSRRTGRAPRSCAASPWIEADAATRPAMAPASTASCVDPPCSDLGTLASRPDARWRKSAAGDRAPGRARRPGSSPRRGRGPAPGGRSSTRPARSRAARTRTRSPACSLPPSRGGPGARDRRPRRPRSGARLGRTTRRCLQIRPDRDRTTGFFICRLRRDDGRDELSLDRRPRPSRRAACPGCGEPWLRPTQLPGRFRCVYCLQRFELVSQCPELRRAPDDRPDEHDRGHDAARCAETRC